MQAPAYQRFLPLVRQKPEKRSNLWKEEVTAFSLRAPDFSLWHFS
jgi:hypothetical protein